MVKDYFLAHAGIRGDSIGSGHIYPAQQERAFVELA